MQHKMEIVYDDVEKAVGFQATTGDHVILLGMLTKAADLIQHPPEQPRVVPAPGTVLNRLNGGKQP